MGGSCAERHAERLQCGQVQMFSGSLIKVWLGVVSPICFSVCDRPVGAEWSGGICADYIKKRLVEAGG